MAHSTIKDVARACGVSAATVSYVINGKRVLREDTRDKVNRAILEMNYHPSAVARGLSSKRLRTLGILLGAVDPIDFISNTYASGILEGIVAGAQQGSFNVTLFTALRESADFSFSALRDGRSDGIVVIGPPLESDILANLAALALPIVAVSAPADAGIPVVDVDNYTGMRLAVQHLLDYGHRRVGYLSGNDNLASYQPRYSGFCDALHEAGLSVDPEFVYLSNYSGSLAFEQTRQMLRHPRPPTAICAGNDNIAIAAIEAARCAGFNVPRHLSVIGFDDIPAAELVTPKLTTIHQPLREIGVKASSLLIESILSESSRRESSCTLIQPHLITRGSTLPLADSLSGS